MDFMSDTLTTGGKFRVLDIVDYFNREVLAIESDTSLPAQNVDKVLEQVVGWSGKPTNESGQSPGIYLDGPNAVVRKQRNRAPPHSARKTHAECLREMLQRILPQRRIRCLPHC